MTKKKSAVEAADEIRREQGREPGEEIEAQAEHQDPEERLGHQGPLEDRESYERRTRRKGCGERR
ncbi:hypothetical protein V6C53_07405 [Desulfocurvibacter africanus]|uniref:Uncharacterized protein n=1 Tax=Desulfocurvibacter africanus subsp. africanus str. Walvis Bay TaxID=690850 RepID=F3YY93_DESAF|nr:hypothetical protein [Desulfocurvibacter africanus]EGJ49537.1 hypothetical protein Desaf_1197 [Desulfocurvibacter africanus subsp. africanus str. Walvis Bay]